VNLLVNGALARARMDDTVRESTRHRAQGLSHPDARARHRTQRSRVIESLRSDGHERERLT
jgi:hypothetical protein